MNGPRVELTPDWVDPVVVEQVIIGRKKPNRELTTAEQLKVIVTLREKGWTDSQIATRLGCGMSRISTLMRGPRLRGRR